MTSNPAIRAAQAQAKAQEFYEDALRNLRACAQEAHTKHPSDMMKAALDNLDECEEKLAAADKEALAYGVNDAGSLGFKVNQIVHDAPFVLLTLSEVGPDQGILCVSNFTDPQDVYSVVGKWLHDHTHVGAVDWVREETPKEA